MTWYSFCFFLGSRVHFCEQICTFSCLTHCLHDRPGQRGCARTAVVAVCAVDTIAERAASTPRAAVGVAGGLRRCGSSSAPHPRPLAPPIGRLQRTRRRLRRELMARLLIGQGPAAVAPTLLRFVRKRADIRNATQRVHAVRATSFNLAVFSTEQALSLFRFQPGHVGRLAGLLCIDDETFPGRHRASCIERLCIVLRRLSSPTRWMDLEVVFGRCSSALREIFYETVEALRGRWENAFCSWRGDLIQERAAM